jgi:hypothetical protein
MSRIQHCFIFPESENTTCEFQLSCAGSSSTSNSVFITGFTFSLLQAANENAEEKQY